MANTTAKHFQFLRKGGFASLDAAKTGIENYFTKSSYDGEPIIAYYGTGTTKQVVLGIGGKTSGSSVFYNAATIDDLFTQLKDNASTSADTLGKLEKAINAETEARKKAIEDLDVAQIGETGKFIRYVKEEDGKISATADTVAASEVSYASGKTDAYISSATTVASALGALDSAIQKSNAAQKSYKIAKITNPTEENVKEAYKLQVSNDGGEYADVDGAETINIYKDQTLSGVTFEDQKLHFTYILANGKTETVDVDMASLVLETEVEKGIQAIDGKLSVKIDSATEKGSNDVAFLTTGVNGVKVDGIKTEIETQIQKLDATVTAKTDYSTISVEETDGKLTKVEISNTIGKVSGTSATKGYAEASEARAYIDAAIAAKNVAATGDSYVSASAADNKVTVQTNVADLVVTTTAGVDSTLTGTATKLVDGNSLATGVTAFVNARISEEIEKLDVAETTVSATNVSFKYAEEDAKVNISDLTVKYATVSQGQYVAESKTSPTLKVTAETALAVGSDIAKVANYASDLVAQEKDRVDALEATVTDTNTVESDLDNLTVSVTTQGGNVTKVAASISVWDCGTWA